MRKGMAKTVLSLAMAAALTITTVLPAAAASTDPTSSAAREAANAAIAEEAATQGMVLLDNSQSVLPIAKSGNIALYGTGVYNTVKGGSGSGDVYLKDGFDYSVLTAFDEAGYNIVNKDFLAEQKDYVSKNKEESVYDADVIAEAAKASDTAIFVISRTSAENADRTATKGDYYLRDSEAANLATVGKAFKNVIVVLNVGGVIDTNFYHGKAERPADDSLNRGKIDGLDALLLMSQAGQEGGKALVKILNGTENPSGKLTDTWAVEYADYPSSAYFAANNGVDEDGNVITSGGDNREEYYTDDIFVGYRYFDTFGVDVAYPFGYGQSYTDFEINVKKVDVTTENVTVTAEVSNKGDVDGREVVEVYFSAPAGTIEKPYQELAAYEKVEVKKGETETVTVTFDTSDMSSYDETNEYYVMEKGDYTIRVGNGSRNTIAAATITLDNDVITEYASNELGTTKAELASGTYENGMVLNGVTQDPETKEYTANYGQVAIEGFLDASSKGYQTGITPTTTGLSAEAATVSLSAASFGASVTHEYANGNITTYYTTQDVTGDAEKTSLTYAQGKASAEGKELSDGDVTITTGRGTETITNVDTDENGNKVDLTNATLMDVAVGNITVEQLVASMTTLELADLVTGGSYSEGVDYTTDVASTIENGTALTASSSIHVSGTSSETTSNLYRTRLIPNISFNDGPAGLRLPTVSYSASANEGKIVPVTSEDVFDPNATYFTYHAMGDYYSVNSLPITTDFTESYSGKYKVADGETATIYYQYCTAIPVGTMLAQTWDKDLVERVGRAIGVEMLEYGVTSWLAPGMNIHRNPLCGRNFEYYSEDPVIAGTIAAAETKGVQTDENGNKTGVGVTLKHFAFNNQESNRFNNNSVMSERAAREIYLKGFQIAVETAQPDYIMSSYNSINGTQTFLNYGLLTEILRNEWGFKGFVMTDWNSMDNAYAGRRGLLYGSMTDAFKKVAQPEGTLTYTDFDVCARAQLMYAGNDSEMPGAANYGVTSPNTALVYKALNSNIVDENGDSYMRLGDLQRNAINILNVILDTEIFQTDIYAKTSTYYLLKKANNDNASAETTITDLTTELDQTKEDLKQAQDDLEQAKTEQNALDQKVSDLQKQIEDLKAAGNKNEGSDANKAAAQKELEQAKADLKQAQADKAALNEKAESLQNSVDELTFASKTASVKSAKSKSAKTLKIALKSVADAEKYEITYATNKKFKGSKTVTVSKTSAVIKKLKSKKTYYVKVRAVKTVGGKTVKTGYSAVKKVKVK